MLYWFLKWIAIGPVLRLVFRPKAYGIDNVPEEGPAILASNHLSYADWLFMPLTLTRRVTFVAKAEYFTTPGVKGWFQKKFFSGAGQVPIDRSGASAAEGAMKSAMKILAEGELFGIYPEGTRSHDGRLYRGKTGVARLALESKAPVIPCAVVGTDVVAPAGKVYGTWTRPVVRFGKPLDFSRYEGMENDRFILRSITDEIMYEIMRLSEPGVRRHVCLQGQGEGQGARQEARHGCCRSRPLATRPATGPSRGVSTPPLTVPRRGRRAGRRGPPLPGARHPGRRRDRRHGRPRRLRPRQLRAPQRALLVVVALVVWTGVAIAFYDSHTRRTSRCWSRPSMAPRSHGSGPAARPLQRHDTASRCGRRSWRGRSTGTGRAASRRTRFPSSTSCGIEYDQGKLGDIFLVLISGPIVGYMRVPAADPAGA